MNNKKGFILYVGKTKINFHTRLKQHLSNNCRTTYGMHLKEWVTGLNLKLRLHYTSINIKAEEEIYLGELESILHIKLKPLLGKKGDK